MSILTRFLKKSTISISSMDSPPVPQPTIEPSPKPKDYRLEGQRRDAFIVELVRRQGVITSDLVQLASSHEDFDLPGESRQALLNRLTVLADRGYFHRLGRTRSGHIAYGTRKPRKGTQPQVEHDLIGARFGVHLDVALSERSVGITDLVADQAELRLLSQQQGWQFVPDRIFMLNGVRYFCEWDNDTESPEEKIIPKIEAYRAYVRRERQRKEMMEKLGEKVNSFVRVLWVTVNERRAQRLISLMDGNLYWAAHEGMYLGNPSVVLSPIWKVGRINDDAMHGLLESSERDRSGV